MTSSRPSLSLCMIAKNEEDWIAQAIQSVRAITCETIVVDTGSTDRTVEIAESLGAIILHQPWENDFSKPRNLSLERASGDWILVLDADEAINPKDLDALVAQMRNRNLCYEMKQRHYSNDQRLSDFQPVRGENPDLERHYGGFFESGLVRLFPNGCGVKYVGRIHELVEHSIYRIPQLQIVQSPIRIHHYGHTEEVKAKKNKAKLYTPLGQTKTKEIPNHWQAFFELGVEHNCNGNHRESVTAFLRGIDLNPDYVPAWVNLGYVYCELREYKNAVMALSTAIDRDPKNEEAYCNLSVVYLRVPQHQLAEKYARLAVTLNPRYVNAYCNLGKAIAHQGRMAEAALVFERAIELLPQCTSAKMDLGALHLSVGNFAVAERYFLAAIHDNPRQPDAYYNLGIAYKMTSEASKAVQALENFCELSEASGRAGDPQIRKMMQIAQNECASLRTASVQGPA